MNCSDSQIFSHFFNQHDSSLGRQVNATSQNLRNSSLVYQKKQGSTLSENLKLNTSFSLLFYIMKVFFEVDRWPSASFRLVRGLVSG